MSRSCSRWFSIVPCSHPELVFCDAVAAEVRSRFQIGAPTVSFTHGARLPASQPPDQRATLH